MAYSNTVPPGQLAQDLFDEDVAYQQAPAPGMVLPQIQPYTSDFNWKTLDNSDVIYRIEMRLRGYRFSPVKKAWLASESGPLMNEKGIACVSIFSESLLSHNIILSNYSERQIENMMLGISETIVNSLANNYWEWGLDKKNLDLIYDIIHTPIYAALMRSVGGKEGKQIRSTISRIESSQYQAKQEESKRFGGFFNLLAKKKGGE